MNNFFENLFDMQKKAYENFLKNFNLDFMNFDYFKNLSNMNFYEDTFNIFKEYTKFQDYAGKSYKELFNKIPGYEQLMDTYKKNLDFMDKLFKAYKELWMNVDFSKSGNKLIECYNIFNDQLIYLAKNNIEKYIPVNFYDMMANFSTDNFLKPIINNSDKAFDFYQKSLDKVPEIDFSQVEKFYKTMLDKLDDMPTVGITEEKKNENKKMMENYLNLCLKLYDFNLYLNKASRQAALDAQKSYFDKLENQEGLENFTDFYKFYMDNLLKAYEDMIKSPMYQNKANAIFEMVNKNKSMADDYIERELNDFPIMTQNKFKEYLEKLEDLSSVVMDVKNEKYKNQKDIADVKAELTKVKKDIKVNEDREDISSLKKDIDDFKKKDVDPIKKDVEQIKELKDEIKALKEEVKKLKGSK